MRCIDCQSPATRRHPQLNASVFDVDRQLKLSCGFIRRACAIRGKQKRALLRRPNFRKALKCKSHLSLSELQRALIPSVLEQLHQSFFIRRRSSNITNERANHAHSLSAALCQCDKYATRCRKESCRLTPFRAPGLGVRTRFVTTCPFSKPTAMLLFMCSSCSEERACRRRVEFEGSCAPFIVHQQIRASHV